MSTERNNCGAVVGQQ